MRPYARCANMKSQSPKRCSGTWGLTSSLVCVATSCSPASHRALTFRSVPSAASAPVARHDTAAFTAPASPATSELRESPVDRVRFEGRDGASLGQLCAEWKSELLAAIKSEQDAGFGYDDYDAQGIVCVRGTGEPDLEGTLPYGWSILASVNLQYFDGVAALDERYLLLNRADGALVVGPKYRTSNDIGDTTPPAACRLAMVPLGNVSVLVVGSLEIGDRATPLGDNGEAGPSAHYAVRHSGRTCRFEPTTFTCEPKGFTVFKERSVNSAERTALLKAPKPELPDLDADTGKILEVKGTSPAP